LKGKTYAALREAIEDIWLVDCHEHIGYEDKTKGRDLDLFGILKASYAMIDILAAGGPTDLYVNPPKDKKKRWEALSAFLPKVQGTAYYRCMLKVFQDLFDLEGDEINEGNWEELDRRINEYVKRPDWYHYVMKERAKIDVAIHGDETGDVDSKYYRPIMPTMVWLFARAIPQSRLKEAAADTSIPFSERMRIPVNVFGMQPAEGLRKNFENLFGVPEDFDGFVSMLHREMKRRADTGTIGVKIPVAYFRALRFEDVPEEEAKGIFNKPDEERTALEFVKLQDFIAHEIVRQCRELNLVVQVHTGIQAGIGNYLEKSNPLHLTNLFFGYPDVKFDVFHGGYPFCGEIGVLAKSFPNVYLDFCWMPIISPSATRRHLREWIETVPGSKLLWGGDAHTPEEGYGTAAFARDTVAATLAEAVDDDYISMKTALDLAHMILRENALDLFNIKIDESTRYLRPKKVNPNG
jgi:predicted TIM-barrel fold metal-dependent hydrolase